MDGTRIRVLVLEGDTAQEQIIRGMLAPAENPQFVLESASRLSLGLERLAVGEFDLILLDLNLPDSQGLNMFQAVTMAARAAPLVVLADVEDETLALRLLREGAQDYLLKSRVDSRRLGRAIRFALARHRVRDTVLSRSLTDELTGLRNRRGFLALAEQQCKVAQRNHQRLLVVLADLNGLAHINDAFGRREGDRALIETAEIFRRTYRNSDPIGCVSGGEFAAALLGPAPENDWGIAQRLQSHLSERNAQPGLRYPLTLTVGVEFYDSRRPCPVEDLLARANARMNLRKDKAQSARAGAVRGGLEQ